MDMHNTKLMLTNQTLEHDECRWN